MAVVGHNKSPVTGFTASPMGKEKAADKPTPSRCHFLPLPARVFTSPAGEIEQML
jgi:hypothetical protein